MMRSSSVACATISWMVSIAWEGVRTRSFMPMSTGVAVVSSTASAAMRPASVRDLISSRESIDADYIRLRATRFGGTGPPSRVHDSDRASATPGDVELQDVYTSAGFPGREILDGDDARLDRAREA